MSKVAVDHLQGGVPITMLIPLYARAAETQKPQPIIRDPHAVEMIAQIDYDFTAFAQDTGGQWGIAIRTEILDEHTRAFLERQPQAQVINLGAGLDTRFWRVDNGQVQWVELDLPESIQLREHFLAPRERHSHLPHSALDAAWMTHPAIQPHLPTLILAEGLLMYFTEEQVKGLLIALADHFPQGEVLFEMVGEHLLTYANPSVASTQAQFLWGLDETRLIATWDERLHVLEETSIYDRYPEQWRAIYPALKKPLGELRHKVTKIVHLGLGKARR